MAPKNGKPKPKSSAFTFFLRVYKEHMHKQQPNTNMTYADVSKLASDQWKLMNLDQKIPYQQMAERDKQRFDQEMSNYEEQEKRQKKQKDPNAPKKPLTGFFCFSGEQRASVRASNPDAGLGGIAKILGQMWNNLAPDLKVKYNHMAEQDKARYQREMANYNNSSSSYDNQQQQSQSSSYS